MCKNERNWFLEESSRFVVAMTRAKHGLIIVGNLQTFLNTENDNWAALLSYLFYNGCIKTNNENINYLCQNETTLF